MARFSPDSIIIITANTGRQEFYVLKINLICSKSNIEIIILIDVALLVVHTHHLISKLPDTKTYMPEKTVGQPEFVCIA